MQSRLLKRVDPVYPGEAQTQRIGEMVVLGVHIDKDGNVIKAEKVSGRDLLVPAGIEAVKQWKYQPTMINGAPIEVETTVEINFAL